MTQRIPKAGMTNAMKYVMSFQYCSMIPGLIRFLTGIMFVSGYGLLGRFFPSKYLISDEYAVRVHPNLNQH